MALSYDVYYGDGSTSTFTVTFGYLKREDIFVYVDAVETAFTWDNDTTIRITPAPTLDARIVIRRETDFSERQTDFTDDSILDEVTLDRAYDNLFYIVQESAEKIATTLSIDQLTGNWSFDASRVTDVGDPVDPQDAVTKAFLDSSYIPAVEAYIAEAEAARDKAQKWAEEAEDVPVETGKFSALHHKEKALDAQGAAETAQGAAETAQGLAETAQGLSEDARDKAQLWAEEDEDVEVEPGEYSAKHYKEKSQALYDAIVPEVSTTIAAIQAEGATQVGLVEDEGDAQIILVQAEVAPAIAAKNDAQAAEALAEKWAEEAEDVEVETGKYSAKHHATKAAATVAGIAAAGDAELADIAAAGDAELSDIQDEGDTQVARVTGEGNTQYTRINGLDAVLVKDDPTGAAAIPAGTTAQRPTSPAAGDLRFNSTDGTFEGYDGSEWGGIGGGVTVGSSSFVGSGGEVTIAHGLGATPSAVNVVPTSDPSGYLGEMWVRKDSTNIYVGNSGSHTGTFDWMAIP